MPNWKKLIVSGSDASLNSLNVTQNVTAQSFTGSFTGSFTAPGATTQVVYNNNGVLSANSGFVYSGSYVGIGTTNPNEKFVVQGNGARIKIQTAGDPAAYYTFLESNYDASNTFNIVDGGSYRFGSKALVTYNDTYINGYYNVYIATGTVTNNSAANIRLFVDQNGNIGIGTTAPGYRLDVTGDINFSSTLKFGGINVIAGLSTDIYANIRVIRNESTTLQDGMYIGYNNSGGSSGHLRFYANGTNERMRIDASSGNVGIGTATPVRKLHVYGDVQVDTNLVVVSGIYNTNYYAGGATATYFKNSVGADTVAILESGLVGIGTVAPTAKLEVIGNVKATSFTGSFSGSINTAVSASYALSSSYALSGSYSNFALTASYALNAADSVWTGSGTDIYYNQGNVGIGVTNPSERLHVSGAVRLNDVYFKSNNPASFPNFAIGNSNFTSTVTGYGNIAFGYEALSILTSGRYNVAAGYTALANVTTGQANVAVGPFALRQTTTGTYNIGIGDDALTNNINGSYNIGFGSSALENNINGEENIGIGEGAIQASKHGSYNIAMGYYALNYLTNTTSSYNIGIGYLSGGNLAGGIHNTYLGNNLHVVSTGSYNVFIGGNIAVNALGFSSATNTVVIADNSGNVKLLANSAGNIGIGTTSPSSKLEVYTATGDTKLTVTTTGGNSYVPRLSLDKRGDSAWNISSPAGGFNFAIDQDSSTKLWIASGTGNVGIGTTNPQGKLEVFSSSDNQLRLDASGTYSAMYLTQNQTPKAAVWMNNGTLGMFVGTTVSNGYLALGTDNSSEKVRITAAGYVGIGNTTPGTALVVNGGAPGQAAMHIRHTEPAGYSGIDFYENTGTHVGSLWHANSSGVASNQNAMTLAARNAGDKVYIVAGGYDPATSGGITVAAGNVGIGTTSPGARLEIDGNSYTTGLRISDTTSHSTNLFQNGTVFNINSQFVGDSISIQPADYFKISTYSGGIVERLRVTNDGNVGIGTASPTQKLDVAGAISVSGSVIDYEVAPALIGPGPAVNIVSFVPGTTKAAFVDYVIVDSSGATNQRVGTIMVSINLNTVSAVLNEVTTVDIGNTSAITFAVAYGAPTWLTATNSGITPYDISYMVRYF